LLHCYSMRSQSSKQVRLRHFTRTPLVFRLFHSLRALAHSVGQLGTRDSTMTESDSTRRSTLRVDGKDRDEAGSPSEATADDGRAACPL